MAFTTVRSASGVDFIGTPGVDVGIIFDETGNVTLSGLGDADIIQVNNSTLIQRTSSLNGGDGADRITFVGTSISDSSINGNKGADIISLANSVSNSFVGGGEGSDNIYGSGGEQYLASKIEGGAGSDTISLSASLALATVNGGDGNDTIRLLINTFISSLANSSINGNAGNDIIEFDPITNNITLSGTNFIGGGAGDDTINVAGITTDNSLAAFSKGFDLTGGSGNDIINGSRENDTIWGNADNDTIQGNQGKDTIYAGAGKDTITVLDSGDVITGGAGGDIYSKAAAASSTFIINSITESAAATTGTAAAATLTFDSFTGYAFAAGDVLNISAVTNQLAGGPYTGVSSTTAVNIGGVFVAADFAALKTQLDLGMYDASNSGFIQAWNFTANIAGGGNQSYTWIQDSQKAYSSSDLLFQTAAGGFNAGTINLV